MTGLITPTHGRTAPHISNMDLLIERVATYRADILGIKFFQDLRTGRLDRRRWLWQLLYWSGWFTRALAARAGACEDERFADVFADHASQEARHPAQLKQYLRQKMGWDVDASWPAPSPETVSLRDEIRCIALHGAPLIQILVMNVLSEGAALDFYGALLEHFGTDSLRGPYFHVHRDVDDHHRLMGVSLLAQPSNADVQECLEVLFRIRNGYQAMIDSWGRYEIAFQGIDP